MNTEFKAVLDAARNAEASVITRTVDGVDYHRKFIPEDRLILLGGGHISQAVSRIAVMMDFAVTVVDDRPAFANAERFPEADAIICDSFPNAIDTLQIRKTDYVCVLTRGHRHDAACVRHILAGTAPYYLGMIGSRRRVTDFIEVLRSEGYSEEQIASLHAPIGVSIGALTPPEIGLSICAELVATRRKNGPQYDEACLEQTNAELDTLRFLAESDTPRALLLVLETSGSTPAKAGAIMAIDALGNGYGTVGGGCSEAAVIGRARRLIGTGRSDVVTVDMTNEVAEEIGMVCGGEMKVYIEDVTQA